MATAETARLIASLELKDQFSKTADSALGKLGKIDAAVARSGGRAYKAGTQIGTGIRSGAIIAAGAIGFLGTQVFAGIKELGKLETATAQTNAVLVSTKGAAGQTADSVRNLAEEYEGLNATIDDKVIQSGENLLLTFTKIRKDAFEPALLAALNLNTRLGGGEGGLQNTIKLVGKALNDPLKGLGALSKAGITFDKQQTDQIKTLIKNNDLLGAQNLILAELGKRYGGAFKAEGATAEGTLKGIGDAGEDLQKTLATGLFPVVQKVLPKIRSALADPQVIAQVSKLGDSIAGLFNDKNLAEGGRILGTLFETAKAAAPVVQGAAAATLNIVKSAVGIFRSLPEGIQQLAVGAFAINKLTGGLVTNVGGAIAGGIADAVLRKFSGVVNVNGAVVNVNGLPGGLPGTPIPGPAVELATNTGPGGILSALGVAFAGFKLGQDTIAAGVEKGVIAADGKLITHREGNQIKLGPAPAGSTGSSSGGLSLGDRDLIAATKAAGDKAAMDARRIEAAENRNGLTISQAIARHISALGQKFGRDLHSLRAATKPLDIAKFARAIAADVAKGSGSVAGTKGVLKDLRIKLAETHDPKTAAILRAAIQGVQAKLPERVWVDKEIALGRKIAGSSDSTTKRIADLKTIEASLRAHGDRHAANTIHKLEQQITATKGVKTAALETQQAVKDKDLSVTVPVNVQNTAYFNGRIVNSNLTRYTQRRKGGGSID